jgi:hypothetical protein
MGSKVGDLGGTSHSLPSSAESLTRESIDCVEGTRKRGGTLSSRRRDGDCGLWLRAGSICVSHASSSVEQNLLWTQKAKLASVSSLCARWSYSTNLNYQQT